MYRWIISVALVCLFLLCPMAHAQKIGYVSTDAIRAAYESNKQAEERLNSYVEEWKTEIAQRQRDIDDLELEIRKNRLIWSDQERQAKEKEIEEKRHDRDQYARLKFEPGGEHDQQAENLFKAIWNRIYLAVQKVSAAEGYDIVWDKSVQPLVYVNAKYDITVKVMKELGIDADELERKQKEVVDTDPRNKRAEEPRRRKSRSKTADSTVTPPPGISDTTNLQSPVVMPNGLLPNGLPPNGETPGGGGPSRSMPQPLPLAPPDTTKKEDVPR
ncbi:MAG: OmpH family outer membrane protein [Candidatus Kapabacteria bacterium]|nr:OmpH family outer membrane protein [Candidatus Kapabacteria bacterium]